MQIQLVVLAAIAVLTAVGLALSLSIVQPAWLIVPPRER